MDTLLLLGGIAMIYIALLAPLLFKYWIIPKISARYNVVLKIEYPPNSSAYVAWQTPPINISWYIFCKYIRWQRALSLYHKSRNIGILNQINYDIKTASLAEKMVSLITIFCLLYFVILGCIIITLCLVL